MQNIPFNRSLIDGILEKNKVKSVGSSTIREVKKLLTM